MKIILHIGSPKTGSTSLQEALAMNKSKLLEHGILYPSFGKSFNHNYLATTLAGFGNLDIRTKLKFKNNQNLYNKYIDSKWKELNAEIKKTRPDKVILSSEKIFSRVNTGNLKQFKSKLNELSNDISVVAYIRRPSDFYLSNAQQIIKSSATFPPPAPIAFRETLENCSEEFDDLKVLAYDRSQLIDGDIIIDFFSRFIPESPINNPSINNNVTLSLESMEILRLYREQNHFDKNGFFLKDTKMLMKMLQNIENNHSLFKKPKLKNEIQQFIDLSSIDLVWLKEKHGVEFKSINYSMIGQHMPIKHNAFNKISDICEINHDLMLKIYSLLTHQLLDSNIHWYRNLRAF